MVHVEEHARREHHHREARVHWARLARRRRRRRLRRAREWLGLERRSGRVVDGRVVAVDEGHVCGHGARVAGHAIAPQPRVPALQHRQAVVHELAAQCVRRGQELRLGRRNAPKVRRAHHAQPTDLIRLGREEVREERLDAASEPDGVQDGRGRARLDVTTSIEVECVLDDGDDRGDRGGGRVRELIEEQARGRREHRAIHGGHRRRRHLGHVGMPLAGLVQRRIEHLLQLGLCEGRSAHGVGEEPKQQRHAQIGSEQRLKHVLHIRGAQHPPEIRQVAEVQHVILGVDLGAREDARLRRRGRQARTEAALAEQTVEERLILGGRVLARGVDPRHRLHLGAEAGHDELTGEGGVGGRLLAAPLLGLLRGGALLEAPREARVSGRPCAQLGQVVRRRRCHELAQVHDVAESEQFRVELGEARIFVREVRGQVLVGAREGELRAELREQLALALAQPHRALEAEDVPIRRRRIRARAEVVEKDGARGGQVRVRELRALGLDLEVAHLEGKRLRRPLILARVVQREVRGHIARAQAQHRVRDRDDGREDQHSRRVGLRREGDGERGRRVVAREHKEPTEDLGLRVVRDLQPGLGPEAAHLAVRTPDGQRQRQHA